MPPHFIIAALFFGVFGIIWKATSYVNVGIKLTQLVVAYLNIAVMVKGWPHEFVYVANALLGAFLWSIWEAEDPIWLYLPKTYFGGIAFWAACLHLLLT